MKYRVVCLDHVPFAFVGGLHDQRYKASDEMWKHRYAGHVHARVEEVPDEP